MIADDFMIIDRNSGTELGKLRTSSAHMPNLDYLRYRRQLWT
jgi:hypothetical protein